MKQPSRRFHQCRRKDIAAISSGEPPGGHRLTGCAEEGDHRKNTEDCPAFLYRPECQGVYPWKCTRRADIRSGSEYGQGNISRWFRWDSIQRTDPLFWRFHGYSSRGTVSGWWSGHRGPGHLWLPDSRKSRLRYSLALRFQSFFWFGLMWYTSWLSVVLLRGGKEDRHHLMRKHRGRFPCGKDFHPGFSGTEPVYFPSSHGSAQASDRKRLCCCTRQARKKGRSWLQAEQKYENQVNVWKFWKSVFSKDHLLSCTC